MNLNPFDIIDDLLADYAGPRARRLFHAALMLAVALVAIWQAAEGDWMKFGLALLAALYAAANKANTPPTDQWGERITYTDGEPENYPNEVSGNADTTLWAEPTDPTHNDY